MYINIVHFSSKLFFFLGGGENNPVMSSISDQCSFHAKYDKTHQLEHVFLNFSGSKITHSKSVARCVHVAIIDIFIINSGTF